MAYDHLHLEREAPVTERHTHRPPPPWKPEDPRSFGSELGVRLGAAKERLTDPAQKDIGGFDERRLLKLTLRGGEGKMLPEFDRIPGVQTLSQEVRIPAKVNGDSGEREHPDFSTHHEAGFVPRVFTLGQVGPRPD